MAFLEVEGTEHKISLDDKAEYTLGRIDPASHSFPDIDLTPYAGVEAGVSRRHAKVTRLGEDRYYIMDLSSTNFTHINGEKLEAFEPKVLEEGDEIYLGTLKFVFHH
ncbi:MAG: FHA domain-containing protein [Actinobacteria bacterium]|nr:FHA domain-containing protein [Actinomycetota bacterium]